MADQYYAWSLIRYGVNDGEDVVKRPGDKVAQGDFPNMSDEEWQQMVAGGSVRNAEYPEDLTKTANPLSPVEHYRQKLQEMEEGLAAENTAVALSSSLSATPGSLAAATEEMVRTDKPTEQQQQDIADAQQKAGVKPEQTSPR